MKLTEMKVNEFVDLLASDAPAPGGGSASALAASLGIALTNMVASLTVGKKKYAEYDDLMKVILSEAGDIKNKLVASIDEDTEAFNGVSAVFSMPKDTDEEKAARTEAMQKALKAATLVPYGIMENCLAALKVTQKAVGKSNINAASDLGVAALTLDAGVKGAGLNVLINVAGIKDESFVREYKDKYNGILAEAEKLSKEIYSTIQAEMM